MAKLDDIWMLAIIIPKKLIWNVFMVDDLFLFLLIYISHSSLSFHSNNDMQNELQIQALSFKEAK